MTSFSSSCPQFFKLLLQRNLEDGKLMIPKQFVKEYGKLLPSSISLKVPDGMKWKVNLAVTSNGAVWLQNGWLKFTEHYNLEFGSLLVFKFDGNSTFQTAIFDPTGVETQYCSNSKQHFQDSDSGSGSDSDESRKSYRGSSKKRKKASSSARVNGRSRKKFKVCNEDTFSVKAEPEAEDDGCEPSSKKGFSSKAQKPSFKVEMKQSNVGGRFNMFIPKDFAKKYLSESFGMIKLQTVNGKTWPLIYKWSRENVPYISSGWKIFVQKNHLKKGDVGVFEFLNKDTFSFKLQQAPPSPSPSLLPNKTSSSTAGIRHPFFEVDVNLGSYPKAVQYIPSAFAKKHLSRAMRRAQIRVGKKQWVVTIKQYHNSVRFSAGWSTFSGDNGLEDGDTCLFEMINEKKCVFQVTIFRKV